jgi:hypothetical protein
MEQEHENALIGSLMTLHIAQQLLLRLLLNDLKYNKSCISDGNLKFRVFAIRNLVQFSVQKKIPGSHNPINLHGWWFSRNIYFRCTQRQVRFIYQRFILFIFNPFQALIVYLMGYRRVLGRRNSVLVSIIIILISGFCAALSNSYWMFVIFRIFIAFGTAGCMQSAATLSNKEANYCLLKG